MALCVLSGFASGLPLYVLLQLVPAFLERGGVSLRDIGIFALVQLPYVWKFAWAPLLDRYRLPLLGRRRGWMLLTQVLLLVAIGALGLWTPQDPIRALQAVALLVALFGATQDIALDAWRRELLPDAELGLGNGIHVQAYRLSSLVPGSLALVLADHLPWPSVFAVVALFMGVGIVLSLVAPEPLKDPRMPTSLWRAVADPFVDFFARRSRSMGIAVLAFLFLYKLGDSMATALSTPFYLDIGFSLTEIGLVAKNAALWSSVAGGLAGGMLMLRIGINRALWAFGVVQLVSILGFAWLAEAGPDPWVLAAVISFEYLGVGLGTAAFTAYIAREATPALAATQIALFTALTALPRTLVNALTGFLVEGGDPAQLDGFAATVMAVLLALGVPPEGLGWTRFFILCTVLAVPGMLLLAVVARPRDEPLPGRD